MNQQPILKSTRLILRPFEVADAKEVQRLAGDRAIADTTLEIPHPYEDGMAEEWISTHREKFEAGEMVNFAIALLEKGGLIGAIGLRIVPRFERAEIPGPEINRYSACCMARRARINRWSSSTQCFLILYHTSSAQG